MSDKNVDDYITEGIYGKRRPKEAEREQFLGTLRERIVLALTKGQVMSDKGLAKLEEAMQQHRDAKLLINGDVGYRFLKEEKQLADKYNISYTTISNEEKPTDIGAVLAYDYAVDQEEIFINEEEPAEEQQDTSNDKNDSFLSKIKNWFS
nr:YueI family protein [Lentibacillus sediminis]